MSRVPVKKTKKSDLERPKFKPNLPQHNLEEPFCWLMDVGIDADIDLYLEICATEELGEPHSTVKRLMEMVLDDTYLEYDEVDPRGVPDPRSFTQLQAVRALCYIDEGVAAELPRLLPLLNSEDDELREELPILFCCIGSESFAPLRALLLDSDADSRAREGAACCLVEYCETDAVAMQETIVALESALISCTDDELSSYLILNLMDAGAVDSLPIIEEKFLSSNIDPEIVTLEDVHDHFASLEVHDDEAEYSEPLGNPIMNDECDEDVQIPYVSPVTVGRNDPCPCGSGKKYKKCCG